MTDKTEIMNKFKANSGGKEHEFAIQKVLDFNGNIKAVDVRETYETNGEIRFGKNGFRCYSSEDLAILCSTLFYCLSDTSKATVLKQIDGMLSDDNENLEV